MTDLRLRLICHLKQLPLCFFQERKADGLTNIIEHDVEQAEFYLAHGLPEIMPATLVPTVIFSSCVQREAGVDGLFPLYHCQQGVL